MPGIRRRIWDVMDGRNPQDRLSGNLNAAILTLIFFNVVAVILETVDSYHQAWAWQFHAFELFSVAVFTVEYLLRL